MLVERRFQEALTHRVHLRGVSLKDFLQDALAGSVLLLSTALRFNKHNVWEDIFQ